MKVDFYEKGRLAYPFRNLIRSISLNLPQHI